MPAVAQLPAAFRCLFETGIVSKVEDGRLDALAPAGAMAFVLAAIDFKTGKVQLVGNVGAADVWVMPGDTGSVHFLERTASGNVNLTTVFTARLLSGGHFAVHSRHIDLGTPGLGSPLVSHYWGRCEPLH